MSNQVDLNNLNKYKRKVICLKTTHKKTRKCLTDPPIPPRKIRGWKIWKTFLGKNSPKRVPKKHLWTYLMTDRKRKPYSWHQEGGPKEAKYEWRCDPFSAEIAKRHNPSTWFVIYIRSKRVARWNYQPFP
jgi:hypothetical protein